MNNNILTELISEQMRLVRDDLCKVKAELQQAKEELQKSNSMYHVHLFFTDYMHLVICPFFYFYLKMCNYRLIIGLLTVMRKDY